VGDADDDSMGDSVGLLSPKGSGAPRRDSDAMPPPGSCVCCGGIQSGRAAAARPPTPSPSSSGIRRGRTIGENFLMLVLQATRQTHAHIHTYDLTHMTIMTMMTTRTTTSRDRDTTTSEHYGDIVDVTHDTAAHEAVTYSGPSAPPVAYEEGV
jgi:hypothetical protein